MVKLSTGVVPSYSLSLPHYWQPLADSSPTQTKRLLSFSTFLSEPQRVVIGAPQGDADRRREELRRRHPTDTDFMLEVQLHQEDMKRKESSKEDQVRLRVALQERCRREREAVDRQTNPPSLSAQDGEVVGL